MSAAGDETVKLSQLKEWSDTLVGGGFSPATSEVTISNSFGNTKTIKYMGVDGSYQKTIVYNKKTVVHVPIMSNIYVVSNASVKGGIVISFFEDMGYDHTVVCVTEPTCSISLSS